MNTIYFVQEHSWSEEQGNNITMTPIYSQKSSAIRAFQDRINEILKEYIEDPVYRDEIISYMSYYVGHDNIHRVKDFFDDYYCIEFVYKYDFNISWSFTIKPSPNDISVDILLEVVKADIHDHYDSKDLKQLKKEF